jgi:hypothetical protein
MGKKKKKEVEKISGEDEFEFEEPSEIVVRDDENEDNKSDTASNASVLCFVGILILIFTTGSNERTRRTFTLRKEPNTKKENQTTTEKST